MQFWLIQISDSEDLQGSKEYSDFSIPAAQNFIAWHIEDHKANVGHLVWSSVKI